MSLKKFYYLDADQAPVFVKHSSRPSKLNIPESSTWMVYSWVSTINQWALRTYPQIKWEALSKYQYVGREG